MATDMSRDEMLKILASMKVQYPDDTKLTSESLAEKLSRAIDMAQRISYLVPNRIDPSSLSPWESGTNPEESTRKALWESFRQVSIEECENNLMREMMTGERNPPLFSSVFHDIRQTLMHVAYNYESKHRCHIFLVEDKDKNHSIVFRVSCHPRSFRISFVIFIAYR